MPIDPTLLSKIRTALLAGQYNLFLGAGASAGAKNRIGDDIPIGDALRQSLISLKALRATSSLYRAYSQLTEDEINEHITNRYTGCTSTPALDFLPGFVWNRIYTLNIDDCVEAAYRTNPRKQDLEIFTHKSIYKNTEFKGTLQVIHAHGFTGKPDDGYVFSLAEYVKAMIVSNPWISILSQTMASEPFIIAGTRLEEPDLEYFLASRNSITSRKDRGPSILVEPDPDSGTMNDCQRHDLVLYKGTMEDFLRDLSDAFPNRPSPIEAAPSVGPALFSTQPEARSWATFRKDFEPISGTREIDDADYGFFVGRQPQIKDIALERDISRSGALNLRDAILDTLSAAVLTREILLIEDQAGGGKTTSLLRALYDISTTGIPVFQFNQTASLDVDNAAAVFTKLRGRFIIFCDNFADHAAIFSSLFRLIPRHDFIIVGTERHYRIDHAITALGGLATRRHRLPSLQSGEVLSLVEKMERFGLTSREYKAQLLSEFASEASRDPIAACVCRILNDFRPLSAIISTLYSDADDNRRDRYLACALASYCYRPGLPHTLLSSAFDGSHRDEQFSFRDVLPLAFFDNQREYVIPLNPVLAQRILTHAAEHDVEALFEIYCTLGAHIAPFVNRDAIKRRTPEARLAGRLFDLDEVVNQFIRTRSEQFYLRMKRYWEWNSRYWEQFALLKLEQANSAGPGARNTLLQQALTHARHAVRVEPHPLPLTTLGKVLFEVMRFTLDRRDSSFAEGFKVLDDAIRMEGEMNRIALHPYITIFRGTQAFIGLGGKIGGKRAERIKILVDNARKLFPHDRGLQVIIADLTGRVQ